jgi:PAS domain S-box-containing protein
MSEEIRKTGIEAVGDLPWGSHFCQLYETAQDLLDVLVPYFAEGLKNNEFCLWITSEPLEAESAREALAAAVPDLEDRIRRGQIEIIPHSDWYLERGAFDSARVLDNLRQKLNQARAAGFDGLRTAGNTAVLEPSRRRAAAECESAADEVIHRHRMVALCAYSIDQVGLQDMLDLVRTHGFVLVRRQGRWELIESGAHRRTQEALLQSDQELRRARELLEAVTRGTKVMIATVDKDFRYSFFNREHQEEMKRLTGKDTAIGLSLREVLADMPEEREKALALWGRALQGETIDQITEFGEPSRYRRSYRTKHGPIRNEKGEVIGAGEVTSDVTEQVQNRRALLESEERLRLASRAGRIGLYEWNSSRDTAYWSPEACKLFGKEPAASGFEGWIAIVHPDDRERVRRDVTKAIEQARAEGLGAQRRDEFRVTHGDGTVLWLEATTAFALEGGELVMRGAVQDITERKQIEAEVFAANQRMAALMKALPVGVSFSDDPTCRKVTGNPAVLAQFESGPEGNLSASAPDESAPGRQVRFFRDGLPITDADLPLQRAVAENREIPPMELEVHLPSGRRWFAAASGAPIRDQDGKVRGGVAVTVDITQRKQAEEALREAKGQLELKVRQRTAELEQVNARLEKENRERNLTERMLRLEEARLDALLRLSQMSGAPMKEITGFALEQAIALTGSKLGFVGFLDEDESVYTLHAVSRDVVKECAVTGDPMQWHVVDAGIWAEAIRKRETLFVNDYRLPHPGKKGLPPGHPWVERFMVVPIVDAGKIVALAGVGNKTVDYDKSDERQVALLLRGMWGCVQRNLASQKLQYAYGELEEKFRERTATLRDSEQGLKRAQEVAHLGSWELDLIHDRAVWSDETYRIFGLKPRQFDATFEAFLQAVHPEDRAAANAAYSESLAEGREGLEMEFRVVRRDTGEVRTVSSKFEHRRDRSGRVVRSVGIVHDITAQKKTEALRQALAEQERLRLGAAVEQASDSVVMIDLEGRIQYVNAAFESINWFARDTAVGRSYFDFLAGGQAAAEIREAIIQGRPWHGHLTRPLTGGRPIELEVTISPAWDPGGSVIGGLITEKDVTQERALQQQVRQAQKMEALGTLAGGITHDFNNVLGAIVINTELALLDLEESHPARKSLPLVLRAANRGKELIKQIITFSRQKGWEKRPLEVAPVVKETMDFLRSTLPKNVAIREMTAPDAGAVLGDPSHIQQILVNLCQNAALAMEERGGELEVRLEPAEVDSALAARHPELKNGPYLRLTVTDTGCGMSPELMERIFDPFFTTRGPGGGSGLGLAVVNGIVKGYGGVITVASEPGRGSVFEVYIPRVKVDSVHQEESPSVPPTTGGARILLVEDEDAQRRSLARSLERLGFKVTARASSRSALTLFRKDPGAHDLVITDQTMRQMTGLELAAALTKIRPEIPVILCTGFSEKVDEKTVGRDGIRELIMKPFTLEEISQLISRVLKKEVSGR